MKTTKADFLKLTAEARADWLLGCIPSRPDWSIERELFRAGIAEILSLRLRIAYMPLLQGLQRIEDRVNILAAIRKEPYAPPPRDVANPLAFRCGHEGGIWIVQL